MTIEDVKRIVAPLQRRILNMVARATVRKTDDSGKLQKVQLAIFKDEVRDEVDRVQNYGFTSVPKTGSDAIVVYVGGSRDHGVVIATDDGSARKKELKEGEVAVYSDEGDYILLKRGNVIEIHSKSKLAIDSPEVTISGKLTVAGTIQGSEVMTAAQTKLGTHMHPTAAPGSPSSPTPGT